MRNIYAILLALGISLSIVSVDFFSQSNAMSSETAQIQEQTIVDQAIVESYDIQKTIQKIYLGSDLIGVLSHDADVEGFLNSVYVDRYLEEFPSSKLGFGENITLIEELSYFEYENKDQEIFDYLNSNDLFSVEVDKIEFSNGAIIYVKDVAMFEEAREIYVGNFISKEAYDLIRNNQLPAPLTTYGYREVGFSIVETATYQRGLAPLSKILVDVNEIVSFLSYGYGTDIQTYTVDEYDTIEGIAYRTGLSPQQILTINNEKIKTLNQILEVGMELNVTYFDSPINVIVTKEKLQKETVYPASTRYVKDPTIQEGFSIIQTREELGYKDVLYEETYINGEVADATMISSTIVKYPVQEVMIIGTKVIPGIGSGTLRWPLGANSHISCRWYCYPGHQGLDIVYNYNRYGPIYAADRGVVLSVSYDWRSGYHVYIDHNNGMKTLYAHMYRWPPVKVGQTVEKGDFIGNVGNTGRSTGPHLHFGIYVDGVAKNPCTYLGC